MGHTCWVQGVDVDGQIDWFLCADSISDLLDYAMHSNRVDFSCLHDFKSAVSIIVVIAQSTQRRADPSVYVRIIRQQSLSVRVVEVRAVVYGGLKRRGSAEDFGLPGVEVGIEVYDADRTVGFVDGAQEGQRDGMVAAQGYNAGEGLFVLCRADLFCICGGFAHEEVVVTFFDLLYCVGVVIAEDMSVVRLIRCGGSGSRNVRCNRYISTIDHGGPTVERVGVEGNVIAAAESHFA